MTGWASAELSAPDRWPLSLAAGSAAREDAELVAAAIGCRPAQAPRLRALLEAHPTLDLPQPALRRAARQRGLPPRQVRRLLALREITLRWQRPQDSAAPPVTAPREALLQFQDLRRDGKERFCVLLLNSRNQPLACETVALGSLNVAALQPRDVFEPALRHNAAAVILAHSHPSGDPTPSPEDLAVTRHLSEAGRLLGVEVLDHLVIGADRFRSLRESGSC